MRRARRGRGRGGRHGGKRVFASYNSNQVLELPKGWPAPSALPFAGLNGPNAVTVDNKATVYVTDPGNNRVIKLPPQR